MKNKIRVYLRALEIEDHIKIHQWRQDEDIKKYFSGIPLFTSTLNEKSWVENKIFDKNNVSCANCQTDDLKNAMDIVDRLVNLPSSVLFTTDLLISDEIVHLR